MKFNRRYAIKATLLTGAGLFLSRNSLADGCLTTADIEGPYYIPGSPTTAQLAPAGVPGTRLFITGSVYANDCITPIPNSLVDVWHANDGGGYENVNYRGIIYTDASGKYAFESVLPGKYLNGAQYRPRHLHYKVSAPQINNVLLTTQIYFQGDSSIPQDPWASDPDAAGRIIPLTTDAQNAEHGVADFVLDIDPSLVTSINDADGTHKDLIEAVQPNPITSSGTAIISLSRNSRISLIMYNINGQIMQQLIDDQSMNGGIHKLSFQAHNKNALRLSPGVYVLKLTVDKVPKDVKRFVVQ